MSETKEIARAEHLQWCKDRAMEYVNQGDYTNAVASMLSDLGKHPETENATKIGFMLALTVRDRDSATRFVQGFN